LIFLSQFSLQQNRDFISSNPKGRSDSAKDAKEEKTQDLDKAA
jgi:hypothetical protein